MKPRLRHLRLGIFVLAVFVSAALAAECRAVDLSGSWYGNWNSDRCGHHGPMRATFTKINESQYCVHFRGRFWKIMPFRYTVVLNVVAEDDETTELAGSSYLGRIFGTFNYSATASATNFNANYTSCKDWGRFCLTRCSTCVTTK
jgi:hypothetical protein